MRARSLTQGIASIFSGIGMGLGGPLGGYISDRYGWRLSFTSMSRPPSSLLLTIRHSSTPPLPRRLLPHPVLPHLPHPRQSSLPTRHPRASRLPRLPRSPPHDRVHPVRPFLQVQSRCTLGGPARLGMLYRRGGGGGSVCACGDQGGEGAGAGAGFVEDEGAAARGSQLALHSAVQFRRDV